MKPLVLSTAGRPSATAGLVMIEDGGNAVDAVAAAILAWPRSLMSAGVVVALGAGLGRVGCVFPARVPGFGLSRPRRLRLIDGAELASKVGMPCAAPALAALLSRWGSASLPAVIKAASGTSKEPAPHAAALTALGDEGSDAFVRGTFGNEAAKHLGPLVGGLTTRRDMIEARPTLGEAQDVGDELWAARSIKESQRDATAVGLAPRRLLSVAALDRRGAFAAATLDAGPRLDERLPDVLGMPANALLADQPASRAKKVGQVLPIACSAVVGIDAASLFVGGPTLFVRDVLDGALPPDGVPGFVRMLLSPGGALEIDGDAVVERP